jgi:hypothetical protein
MAVMAVTEERYERTAARRPSEEARVSCATGHRGNPYPVARASGFARS